MKTKLFVLIAALLILAGCMQPGPDVSEENTHTGAPSAEVTDSGTPDTNTPTTTPDVSDPAVDEVAVFQELLRGEGSFDRKALASIYDSAAQIDLELTLYGGFPDLTDEWDQFSPEETDFLLGHGLERELAVQKMPADRIEELLQNTFGISLAEVRIPEKWVYYEATDSYYSGHNDAYFVTGVTVTAVEHTEDGLIDVFYTCDGIMHGENWEELVCSAVLTLRETDDGGYLVISNKAA